MVKWIDVNGCNLVGHRWTFPISKPVVVFLARLTANDNSFQVPASKAHIGIIFALSILSN